MREDGIVRDPDPVRVHREASPIDHPDLSVTKKKLSFGSLFNEVHLPVAYFPRGLPADSLGVKSENGGITLSQDIYNSVGAIFLEGSILQLTGGTVNLELYDYTDGVVKVSLSFNSWGVTRTVQNLKPSLKKGNILGGRLNVTEAGPPGSLAGDAWIRLILRV